MTTLVGIKAEKGNPGVIIGSDMNQTRTSWDAQGDFAQRRQTKSEVQKIYVNNDSTAAICMSGTMDSAYASFLYDFLESKFDLEKITHKGFFEDVLKLNLDRWEGRVPNLDRLSGFLLATRYNEPKLYTCWPLGSVEERNYTSIGSGSNFALEYLNSFNIRIPKGISIENGIDLAVESLDKASQDIYTGGLDLIILTKDKILDLGSKIREEVNSARVESIERAKKSLK
jgi:20S proteasome alpha/beta subunit